MSREAVNLSRAGSTPVTHPKFSGRREAWLFPPASEAGKRWFESSRPDQITLAHCPVVQLAARRTLTPSILVRIKVGQPVPR